MNVYGFYYIKNGLEGALSGFFPTVKGFQGRVWISLQLQKRPSYRKMGIMAEQQKATDSLDREK